MLIFVLQSIWLYISELAGKDLEIDVVFKFLMYVSPRLVVLVLPLTILLASIMVFGSFAENYEFAAMKSTGISLQRAMRSLAIFITGLAITTFFFANNVIPWAEFNFYNLRKNLAKVKPAMVIDEGQFDQIGTINIKVDEKSGDRGQYLKNVVSHQKKSKRIGNFTVIKSKTGELTSQEDSDILQLVLYDGNYYDALQPNHITERRKKPHVKSSFEKYTLNVDLSHLNDVDLDEKKYASKYTMLSAGELNFTIDTLKTARNKDYKDLASNMYNRTTAPNLNLNFDVKQVDSSFSGNDIFKMFNNRKNVQLLESAINSVNSTNAVIDSKKKTFALSEKNLNKHIISYYEKFALGFACIILFFVGAPLGALIRKGGFGLPIVIAIVLFLTYHFIGIFAKNSAEDSSLNPIAATWLSTLIMLPLSVYLTNRATKDRTLVNFDVILVPIKKLLNKKTIVPINIGNAFEKGSPEYQDLTHHSNDKLIDIIKNYRQYDLDQQFRNTSVEILNNRGISEEELRFGGNLYNETYENAIRYKTAFDEYARMALISYIIGVIFSIVGAVMNNNGFPTLGMILFVIGMVSTFLFLVAFIKTLIYQTNFYKVTGIKKTAVNMLVLWVLGVPLYFLYYYNFNKQISDDLKQIR
jgi:lipopolysaccharide export system permease protein